MTKANCWEVKHCGRGPRSEPACQEVTCPVALADFADGLNDGLQGGRICWAISGTFCTERISGLQAQSLITCLDCDFYRQVEEEEGFPGFKMLIPGRALLKMPKF